MEWFAEGLPAHPLIELGHPWLEVASVRQSDHVHPEVCIAHDSSVAKFWYNPGTGVVRARVPSGLTKDNALALYNRINQSELTSLYRDSQ